ncbi:Hypothetical predicted protein [Marmota monax]|nr:Hypothetical predicted protein [Marmota monax]
MRVTRGRHLPVPGSQCQSEPARAAAAAAAVTAAAKSSTRWGAVHSAGGRRAWHDPVPAAAFENRPRGVPGSHPHPPRPGGPAGSMTARGRPGRQASPAGPRGRWPREAADPMSSRPAPPLSPRPSVISGGPRTVTVRSATAATAPPAAPAGEGGPPAPPPNLTSNRRLQQTQAQVDEVVDIMRVNVDKVLERDQKLSELDDRADALQAGASQFETSAAKLKRKYWWKNLKMMIILGVICAIILIIIIVYFST